MASSSTDRLRLPGTAPSPGATLGRRVLAALGLVATVTVLVLADRDGYGDTVDGAVSVIDAIYYATVAVTTTGYGDIAPVTSTARLVTALVVTPIRVAFLILVVGTTVEVLTDRWREGLRRLRWRDQMHDHYLICGYGTKGRAAASALRGHDVPDDRIVVIDRSEAVCDTARANGFAVVVGDTTRSEVLEQAAVRQAAGVAVCLDRDDSAVLTTLTVRDLNPDVPISAGAKEEENRRLLVRSGAAHVVVADEATGNLLGVALRHPAHVALLEDLIAPGEGVELAEEPAGTTGAGLALGVVRDGVVVPLTDPAVEVQPGDRVIRIRRADDQP